MRISSNISHWVCLISGLALIGAGLVSHLHVETAASTAGPVNRADAYGGLFRKVVMIAIGFVAVAYALSRLLP